MLTQSQHCAQLINSAKNIVVLTGAGISTNAGIPDFRGPQGLYVTRRYDPDTIFDIDFFQTNPQPFFDFASDFLTLENKIKPTFTHQFLAQLENSGKLKAIITQNIDSLHQRAGSKNVFEMHGSFWTNHCLRCKNAFTFDVMKEKIFTDEIPRCNCGGVIKPDIVFFGESVKYYTEAIDLAEKADLFFVIGTSCVVHPAASVPQFCSGDVVVVNQQDLAIKLNNIVLHVKEDMDNFFQLVKKIMEA